MPGPLVVFLFVLFFGSFLGIGFFTLKTISPTQDEPLHLVSGTAYWKLHDYRLQPENGLASQRWIGLGVLAAGGGEGPNSDSRLWKSGNQWFNAFEFVENSGKTVLEGGRIAILFAGAILLFLVFLLARSLWGNAAGLVALGFGTFSPTFLAHATLATSDVFLALTYFATTWALISLLRNPCGTRILGAGLLCGLAALSKYSAVVLAPVSLGIIVFLWMYRRRPPPGRFFLVRIGALLASAVIAYGIIWCGYGFRYQAFHPDLSEGQFHQAWEDLRTDSVPSKTIAFFETHRIFPEAYLYGAEQTYFYSRARAAFFLGDTGPGGYRLYFPLAFLLKTGPVLLVALLALPILILRKKGAGPQERGDSGRNMEVLGGTFIAAGVFFLFCIFSNLNIGNRHMLPVFPFLFLWTAALVPLLFGWKWRFGLIGGLIGAHASIAVWVMPSFLSYFNPLVGGSKEGYKYYADSSYDWGQEMYILADWLDAHARDEDEVQLILFAPMKPAWYGIDGRVLFQFGAGFPAGWAFPEIKPGLVGVTATMVSGPYYFTEKMGWTEQDEQTYRITKALISEALGEAGENPSAWVEYMDENSDRPWGRMFQTYSRLRIKRLVRLLMETEPVSRPSDTVFLWELSEELYEAAGFADEPVFSRGSVVPFFVQEWAARRTEESDQKETATEDVDSETGDPGGSGADTG